MAKILVVDDEPDFEELIKQKFRHKILKHEYDFVFAGNGKEALHKLEENSDISIVLSDINMPEMDGLTLLSKIDEKYPLTKTVIVSAYSDMSNIRKAMNLGAFDFVTKPLNFEDLQITINKTIVHVDQVQSTLNQLEQKNKTLEKTYHRLEVTNKELDQILYRASHDLKSPISSIQGIIKLFEREDLTKNQTEYIHHVWQKIDQMSALLSSLDTLSKTIFCNVRKTAFDIAALIDECISELSFDATLVRVAHNSSKGFTVYTDRELLKIVVNNILLNSLKYRNQQAPGNIEILTKSTSDYLIIIFSDDGEGISESIQDKIYNLFYRGSERSTGSGLGLYIVKKIMDELQGRVEHSSLYGKTTFFVSLPLKKNSLISFHQRS